jgi:hypothetical protein
MVKGETNNQIVKARKKEQKKKKEETKAERNG